MQYCSVYPICKEGMIRKFMLVLGLCVQVLVAGGLLGWQSSPVLLSEQSQLQLLLKGPAARQS